MDPNTDDETTGFLRSIVRNLHLLIRDLRGTVHWVAAASGSENSGKRFQLARWANNRWMLLVCVGKPLCTQQYPILLHLRGSIACVRGAWCARPVRLFFAVVIHHFRQ